jgi:Aspartyl protease
MKSIRIIAGALLVSIAAASAGAQSAKPTEPVRVGDAVLQTAVVDIPMDHSSGHLEVWVNVNGQGPYLFHLDTGASPQACVDLSLVEELRLPVVDQLFNTAGSNAGQMRDIVQLDTLTFGGASFKNITALAADYRFINEEEGHRVYGLLGIKLFEQMLLTVDYPQSKIRLTTGTLDKDHPDVVPMTVDRLPAIELSIGVVRLRAVLDTGMMAGVPLAVPTAAFDTIKKVGDPKKVGSAQSVNETFDIFAVQLANDIVVGNHHFADIVMFHFSPFNFAIIGPSLVSDFALTLDQQSGLMQLTKAPKAANEKDPRDSSVDGAISRNAASSRWMDSMFMMSTGWVTQGGL